MRSNHNIRLFFGWLGKVGFPYLGMYNLIARTAFTYDHRLKNTGYPVRSAIHKLEIG